MPEPPKPKRRPPDDIAIVHGPTADGGGARVLRLKRGAVYAGEMRPAREGQPITAGEELVRLRPLLPNPAPALAGGARDERVSVCEVEVLHAAADAKDAGEQRRGTGPARVSTDTYRRNWNAVFGAPKSRKPARRSGRSDWSVN